MKPITLAGALAMLLPLALVSSAAPPPLDRPVPAEVYVKGDHIQNVIGMLTGYDDNELTIKTAKGNQLFRWTELTPKSAYTLRSRLIDKNSASDWFKLGKFAWSIDAKDDARFALNHAANMDPLLKPDVQTVLASASGGALNTAPSVGTPATPASPSGEMIKPAGPGGPHRSPTTDKATGAIVRFVKSTPAQDAEAIAIARKQAAEVQKFVHVKFTEMQTHHFIIFTNWDQAEFDFLKTNTERAYQVVSPEFRSSPADNVFVGKLPVFMFDEYTQFRKFAEDVDGFMPSEYVAGYYTDRGDGLGHMAMWKPDVDAAGGNMGKAEMLWAMVLTHEFTHAFVARYRTNRRVPRWLNEGIAEVVGHSPGVFPGNDDDQMHAFNKKKSETYGIAKMVAAEVDSVQDLFDEHNMPLGIAYPVMESMVDTLVQNQPRDGAFVDYFNDLKDGVEPEDALKKHFNVGYVGFEKAWRKQLHTYR